MRARLSGGVGETLTRTEVERRTSGRALTRNGRGRRETGRRRMAGGGCRVAAAVGARSGAAAHACHLSLSRP